MLSLAITAAVACGPIVRTAPFAQRPDSVRPGAMVGPFRGRVVDSDSDKPIADALVWCSWVFQRGLGNTAAEAVRTATTHTDADGRYRVEALARFPQGLSTRLSRLSLVVYKKGYVAYRHNRVFGQRRGSATFSQLDNTVRLSRWSPELSHAEHLMFVGTAPPLVEASRWEIAAAVAELDGRRPRPTLAPPTAAPPVRPVAPGGGLDAGVLLSTDDVRAITGYTGAFQRGRLAGQRSASYDTLHLRAKDKPERYDVAIRVWVLPEDALAPKYEEVLNQLPGSKQTDDIADRSFVVKQGEILGLGFMDRTRGALVLLTCGRGQCSDPKHLPALARRVARHLERLKTTSGERTPAPERPAPDGAGEDGEEDEE